VGFRLAAGLALGDVLKFQSLRGVLVGFRELLSIGNKGLKFVSIPKRGFGGFSLN